MGQRVRFRQQELKSSKLYLVCFLVCENLGLNHCGSNANTQMGLVKYIEKRGLGTVKSTSRFHDENNLVNQTQGVCVQMENQGDLKTRGDVAFPLEEPATMLVDSLRGSESTCSKKRKNDMPERSAKKLCETILYSKSGESSNETEGGESDLVVLDRVECLAESVNKLLTKFKKKAEMEAHLRDQISRYRARMGLQNEKIVKLVKKVRKLKDPNTSALAKGREAMRMVAKNSVEHAKVVEALKKELAEGEEKFKQVHQQLEQEKEIIDKLKQMNDEKLKLVNEELEQKKEMVETLKQANDVEAWKLEVAEEEWRQERTRLENSLERVSSERKWLIEEGFDYVIKRLHRSQEYVEPLVVTKSFLWSVGAHYGVVKGYEACKEGRALEDHFLYEPEANEKFLNAVHIMKHTRFPYIAALSQCTNCSLDELRAVEPIGLEEVDDGNEDEVDGDQ
ncbi:hypothetical protein QVD17_20540 [Tagetes erecta]|uniref:Uncharacterized protein n=1 Tax=Tagetes erecta TaxID=13708 RepID=A0AAD8NY80_TARER|nr:hypothetical protein QVD17_20540 [Tagetes erecta]